MKARCLSFTCGFLAAAAPGLLLALTLHSHRVPNSQLIATPLPRGPLDGAETSPEVALHRFYTDSQSTAEVRIRVASALSMLGLDDLPGLCGQALSLAPVKREAVLKSLLCRWAEDDGPAAMLWGRDHLRGKKDWIQCFLNLGAVWASNDPDGLVEWYAAHRHENDWALDGESLGSRVVEWLAPADVVASAHLACDEVGHTSDYFSAVLAFHIRTRGQARAIAAILKDRTWPPFKRHESGGRVVYRDRGPGFDAAQVARALESRLPELDPELWAAWAHDHPIAADGLPPLLQTAMSAFAAAPSTAAATAAIQAAPPDLLADTMARIIRGWARLDVDAAGQWLTEQGFTDATAPAIAAFARVAVQTDPEAAFAWLEVVPDPRRREQMVLEQFESWSGSDPAAAAAFLDSKQWPDRRLQNIRRMAASRAPDRR